jgi:excisionase family DNA binding protein
MIQLPEDLLTVQEVAKRLRVDASTVRRWIRKGTLRAVALPASGPYQAYRVETSALREMLGQSALVVQST